MFVRCPLLPRLVLLGWLSLSLLQAQDDEGVFADFKTSLGEFTAQLEFEKAPRTTANFVGLATGEQPWFDAPRGRVARDRFYEGITFHRVVEGFVIQAGSPNGEGTDGPGYKFEDEFDPSLRHDGPYVLSMANAGLHTNGSQFFITLAETEFLDDRHSVFGKVVSGMETVDRIGEVAVDANDRPRDPVVIESVTIRRVGEAASAFEVGEHGLPRVGLAALNLGDLPSPEPKVTFAQAPNQELQLLFSEDLETWTGQRLNVPPGTLTHEIDLLENQKTSNQGFLRLVGIEYPQEILTPSTLAGQKLVLDITSRSWKMDVEVDDSGRGGVVVFNGDDPLELVDLSWTQEPYRGVVVFRFPSGTLVPIRMELVFESRDAGWFVGRFFQSIPFNVIGTFTLTQ